MHENWPPSSQAKRKVDWDLWNICSSLLFPFVMLLFMEHFWYEISSIFCISAPSPLELFFCLSAFRSREVVSLLTASTLTHANYCGVHQNESCLSCPILPWVMKREQKAALILIGHYGNLSTFWASSKRLQKLCKVCWSTVLLAYSKIATVCNLTEK